ncbi:MAG: ParM/StbA family protein [Thermoleophilia bacterium]|nr:ParM/StbA family protein [Thermoleophilia bacterium]
MQVIGVDLGFGFTKATDGDRSVIFKSVIGEATSQQFSGSLLRSAETTPEPSASTEQGTEHIHLELDSGEFFFGELAERQSNVRSFTLDQGRFLQDAALPFALAASHALGSLGGPLKMVVGLPISDFDDKHAELERMLLGSHSVTAVDASNARHRGTAVIEDVKVIPEPFGSIYNMILNDRGDIANQSLTEEKVGLIDIGFHTVDFTVSDRTSFLERASRSSEAGIARAFSVIAAKLREKSDVNLAIYRLYDAVQSGRIRIRGNAYDLGKLTEHVFNQLSSEIATQANELWADEWDMDRIVISGGGGTVLSPYLTPMLQGRVETVEPNGDPRLGNAQGFAKYGRHLWNVPGPPSRPGATATQEPKPNDAPKAPAEPAQQAAEPADAAEGEELEPSTSEEPGPSTAGAQTKSPY